MTGTSVQPIATPCRWCGCLHGTLCPVVKVLEFNPDGTVRRVEFHGPLQAQGLDPNWRPSWMVGKEFW